MAQTIDPVKLKAAAEHLEWVLAHYTKNEFIQSLLKSLTPLLLAAKDEIIIDPIDSGDVPGSYAFSNVDFLEFKDPSVMRAYSDFIDELRGGLTPQDLRILAQMESMKEMANGK